MQKSLVLIILDGWGIAPPGPGNAISLSHLEHIPKLWVSYPHTQLSASGESVGLPSGEDGNTETGHINIGAGRVVYQDLPRINMAIADHSFFTNQAFTGAIQYALHNNSNLHIMGLLSDSGVHANIEHLFALLEIVKQHGSCPVYLHLFTDGRDAPPKSSIRFTQEVERRCKTIGIGKIATICGRYYAMDRDRRWERTELAYRALTECIPNRSSSPISAIEESYKKGKTDEFIDPTIMVDENGTPLPRIGNHDAVIFYNYRIDRPRQLTKAFILPDFETHAPIASFDPYAVKYYHKHSVEVDTRTRAFQRTVVLNDLFFVSMTEYERGLPSVVAFPPERVKMPLGRVISDMELRQLRMSETEKERFVTYYFNGMREDPFPGEDHIIVPSPNVSTYDLKPEMSAHELTEKLLDRLKIDVYSLIVVNFANPDMVAHTGNISQARIACEITDSCVGKIVSTQLALGGACIITADHGNVEEMLGSSGEIDTEHSMFPVPFIMVDNRFKNHPVSLPSGKLADIAPTILSYMDLPIPGDMSGRDLLVDVLPKGATNI
ncbi:MAG: 2,3-bisphosphoglycerate-independent phosphoglycerate mutase [bacterium]|nr:2,3-bisphosphoglycerate-independent phosphoglycerate mutase [bacterium]